jgi:hypothetical protein
MIFFWILIKITFAGDPIGILSIPKLAASLDKDAKAQTHSLRLQDFKTVEFDYEEQGIYVVEKIKNKLRLLKSDGSTTIIDMPKLGKFYSIEQLLSGEKFFWVNTDVTFYAEPGSISTVHKPIKLTRNIIGLYELGSQEVPIYSSPSPKSKILRKISENSPWVSRMEVCPCGAIISERKGEWLKVSDVRGERSELLSSEGWVISDGKTRLEPIINPDRLREAQDIIYKDKIQELPVKVLETKVIDSRLWAKLTYDLKDRCGETSLELGSIPANIFWVRVFTDDTKLNHWYYPRGC